MIKLSGILDYSMGGFLCLRGYASYKILSKISDPNPSIQRNLIEEHKGEMEDFLNKGDYLFFPEVILSMELSEHLENEELVQQFYSDLHGGKTWNKRIGDISFSISQNLTKNTITSIDNDMPLVNRINIAHITFDENKHRLLRIDGNHRLSAADELKKYINIPFCLLLFGNHSDNERNSTAIFHNINAKQIPLRLEENLKVILTSKSVFSDNALKTDPTFGWKYYLTRKIAEKINWSNYPIISSLIQNNAYTYIIETLGCLLTDGYLKEENGTIYIFINQMSIIEDVLKNVLANSATRNLAVVGALTYYIISDRAKAERFIIWIKKNHIIDAANIHVDDLISIFDKVYENTPRKVFVSMKFGKATDDTYQTIKDVRNIMKIEDHIDFEILRVDEHEEGVSGDIFQRIVDEMNSADLVIADLSYGNLNVHHEIGYAQGLGKRVLLLYQTRDGIKPDDEIGSNIKMYDQLRYTNQTELRPALLKKLRDFYGIHKDE